MTDEIIKYLNINEDRDTYTCIDNYSVSIKLDKRKLKLLKELHGNIGVKEFLTELTDKIYSEIKTELEKGLNV